MEKYKVTYSGGKEIIFTDWDIAFDEWKMWGDVLEVIPEVIPADTRLYDEEPPTEPDEPPIILDGDDDNEDEEE